MNAHEQANIGGLLTPSNSGSMPASSFFISFAAAGAIAVIAANDKSNSGAGTSFVIPEDALAAGMIHPFALKRVLATGTTATGIVWYA